MLETWSDKKAREKRKQTAIQERKQREKEKPQQQSEAEEEDVFEFGYGHSSGVSTDCGFDILEAEDTSPAVKASQKPAEKPEQQSEEKPAQKPITQISKMPAKIIDWIREQSISGVFFSKEGKHYIPLFWDDLKCSRNFKLLKPIEQLILVDMISRFNDPKLQDGGYYTPKSCGIDCKLTRFRSAMAVIVECGFFGEERKRFIPEIKQRVNIYVPLKSWQVKRVDESKLDKLRGRKDKNA